MARIAKVKSDQVLGLLAHNTRELSFYNNEDIDSERTKYNCDLTPENGLDYEFGSRRCDEKYRYFESLKESNVFYNRIKTSSKWRSKGGVIHEKDKGTVAMAEIVVTLPKSIWNMCDSLNHGKAYPEGAISEKVNKFFEETVSFCCNRYGSENIVSAIVHFDEGSKGPIIEKDFFGRNRFIKQDDGSVVPMYKKDKEGNIVYEYIEGQPHIHIDIAPIMNEGDRYFSRWDRRSKCGAGEKEIHLSRKQIDAGYEGKWAYSCRFNQVEFNTFHEDLQKYMEEKGVDAKVLTGETKINYTIEQLKAGVKDVYEKYGHELDRRIER